VHGCRGPLSTKFLAPMSFLLHLMPLSQEPLHRCCGSSNPPSSIDG
jgi:hypothetical protein